VVPLEVDLPEARDRLRFGLPCRRHRAAGYVLCRLWLFGVDLPAGAQHGLGLPDDISVAAKMIRPLIARRPKMSWPAVLLLSVPLTALARSAIRTWTAVSTAINAAVLVGVRAAATECRGGVLGTIYVGWRCVGDCGQRSELG
jgi:hypothetical protein